MLSRSIDAAAIMGVTVHRWALWNCRSLSLSRGRLNTSLSRSWIGCRIKSDTVAVLAVLPRYPRYYRGNGYKFYGITAVLGSKYAGIPWGWRPGLRYYRGYGVGFTWTVNCGAGQSGCLTYYSGTSSWWTEWIPLFGVKWMLWLLASAQKI